MAHKMSILGDSVVLAIAMIDGKGDHAQRNVPHSATIQMRSARG